MKTKTAKEQTRISRITIGRLYNLGNYEHVRYEMTVEIPEGESAKQALQELTFILKAANPKPPVQTYEYNHAKDILKDPEGWFKNVTDKKERKLRIKEAVRDAKEKVFKQEKWMKQRDAALGLLDEFGGTRQHKDHKEDWQDDDCEF